MSCSFQRIKRNQIFSWIDDIRIDLIAIFNRNAIYGITPSMEFMLSEALPIYSGGLGNVAGDQLKAASDLGVPVVGISLLYQQGYFRQVIDAGGNQQALSSWSS
jgi:glucan phosphorylase